MGPRVAPRRRALRFAAAVSAAAAAALVFASCRDAAEERPAAAPALGVVVQGTVGPLPGGRRAERATNPHRGDAAARADGRRYFVAMNCSGCHGGHGGGGMGPSLRDEVWLYGADDAAIFDSIAQGRAYGMPAWGTMLPEDLIWRLTAYVQSLRTPDEPSPPR